MKGNVEDTANLARSTMNKTFAGLGEFVLVSLLANQILLYTG
jgi:hypothetical protein